MLSSELRVAASRRSAKFCLLRFSFSSARLMASLISSTRPGTLANVVGGAPGLYGFDGGLVVVDRGDQDDGGVGRNPVRVAQHFDAIDIRHLDVGDDDVVERAVDLVLRHLARLNRLDAVSSRRKEISSISQMERSSSQTRMLATATSCGCDAAVARKHRSVSMRFSLRNRPPGIEAVQAQHERGSLPGLGSRPDLALMRLHDLVDDGQPQPGTAFEIGLEGLEDLFDLLRAHARSGIGKPDLPIVAQGFDADGERASAFFHGADRILAEIPEYLFDLVAIGHRPSAGRPETCARS